MAVTPSKDYKRRERELKKIEKRIAREAAKADKAELKAAEPVAIEREPKSEAAPSPRGGR